MNPGVSELPDPSTHLLAESYENFLRNWLFPKPRNRGLSLISNDLSKKEIARIKKVAEGLYETIQAELARIQDFASKRASRDEIKVKIKGLSLGRGDRTT